MEHCRVIARFSDVTGDITRTFLSPAMRNCLRYFGGWAERIGMTGVRVDSAGNFHADLQGRSARRLIIASHLDTVPNAGAYDGVLGVVLGMALAEEFVQKRPACSLEIVGFSEEEGVRFGRPFIGSVAFAEGLSDEFLALRDGDEVSVRDAICGFGLDISGVGVPQMDGAAGYLEFHIEQGPVLESLALPLGVVDAIAGQSRVTVTFTGHANHAGTTPMNLRQDAFCAAAEWVLAVERKARECAGLVATVGKANVAPGAANIVPGRVILSLDVRHARDETRSRSLDEILRLGQKISARRGVLVESHVQLNQPAVPMDSTLVARAERAISVTGVTPHRITSGAGHDAMILAKRLPSAMIFLRSPGGVSHHPDENVLVEDVALALKAGAAFVEEFA
jgi:allantoate deiminase